MAGEPLTVDVRSPSSSGVLSLSSGPSSIGWDSRTPLVHNSSPSLDIAERLVLQLPTSPAPSVDSLGGATDITELDSLDSPEAAMSLSTSHYSIATTHADYIIFKSVCLSVCLLAA